MFPRTHKTRLILAAAAMVALFAGAAVTRQTPIPPPA
jgi:hypothetical protein